MGDPFSDVKRDPNEWENLAGNPEMKDVKKRLAASAPKTFAAPVEGNKFRLVVDGEEFRWIPKHK